MIPRLRGRLLLAASFLVAACNDARDTTALAPERATPFTPPAGAASLKAGDLERVDADVELSITVAGQRNTRAARTHRYHVERGRGRDGVWTTRTTFQHLPARSPGDSVPRPVTVVRRDDDPTPRLFDADGREMKLPAAAAASAGPLAAFPARGAGAVATATTQAAVDAIVLAPGRRAARIAKLQKRLGHTPVERLPQNRARYRAREKDLEIDVTVDEGLGAIVEERVTRGAKLVGHRRIELGTLADGTPVVSRVHSEHETPDGKGRFIIEQAYRNVVVQRGGQAQ